MLFLQFAIGIDNDLADASTDARAGRDKPLVAGQLTSSQARAALYLAAGLGLISAASVGLLALAVAIVGFADGLAYDLRLKGTALSWAPFAAGIALLPVYSWVGATGTWPVALWGVVGLAVPAGVALALANSLADLERDRDFGGGSAATVLGRERTFGIDAALTVVLQLVAGAGSLAIGANPPALAASIAGIGLGWAGVALSGRERRRLRQAGWEVQAMGIVLVGAGWISALSSSGAFGR
jgi:4-hydroxybenzoate polyprenyltransferase